VGTVATGGTTAGMTASAGAGGGAGFLVAGGFQPGAG
jgi:hypothetical protein